MTPISHAIGATLAYHSIFNFPLTAEEICTYLIEKKSTHEEVQKEIKRLKSQGRIKEKQTYFFLRNQRQDVTLRRKREKYSKAKLKKAYFYSKLLTLIPTVKLVGVTGALAMNNSHKNDDIDLMVVCTQNTLWTTRFLANLILLPFKRQPLPRSLLTNHYALLTNNRACLNLFLDEFALRISPQNLYIAHEICQMKPLLDRNQTYSHFIKANKWVLKYLPNWKIEKSLEIGNWKLENSASYPLRTVEIFLKKFQLWYMRKRISTERIGEHQLFFHPQNTQDWVLTEYQKILKELRLTK